jgi:DNA-binding beta-propeller fold protein YncE
MNRYGKILTILLAIGAPSLHAAHSHHEKDAKESCEPPRPMKMLSPDQLYVAFSGESGAKINQLEAYSIYNGSALGKVSEPSPECREMRNMVLDPSSGDLYVVNGYKGNSAVLKFGPPSASGVTRPLLGAVVRQSDMPGLGHPYGIAAFPGGFFVSCQDTNIVAKIGMSGSPAPLPACLSRKPGPFAAGTFVAAFSARDPVPCAVDPQEGGLTLTGAHSVRGIVCNPRDPVRYLCVADQAANRVAVYNARGEFSASETISGQGLDKPTQVLWNGGLLYITCPGSASVHRYDFIKKTMSVFIAPDKSRLGSMSGIAFDSVGNFYVANRDTKAVYRYSFAGALNADPFINFPAMGANDAPEGIFFYQGSAVKT